MKYKIAILGPESSGKSTLAQLLGVQFSNANVVDEYSRTYFESKDYALCNLSDLEALAELQFNLSHPYPLAELLIADTEMITIEIWALDKFGVIPSQISTLALKQQFDLYLLCYPDFPWSPDPLRTDEHRRIFLFMQYLQILISRKCNFSIISGSIETRLIQVNKLMECI